MTPVLVDQATANRDREFVSRNGPSPGCRDHFRVDGKFLARGWERFRPQGVTYGPFAPNPQGERFPTPHRVSDDFARRAPAGINPVRTYHLPPEWFLGLADDRGLGVFVDVPWPRHLCFLESERAQAEARRFVRQAAKQGRDHPCLLAYSIGNEI